ncbi:MAG: general secretion pathway protein GspK [Mariniblastus sp.]
MTCQTMKTKPHSRQRRSDRCGSLLLIVLVTIVILSLSAYTFTALMRTEEEVVRLETRQVQSKYLVESGLDFIRFFLTNSDSTIREKGGRWNNTQYFQAIPVAVDTSDPKTVGYFSIVTSNLDEEGNAEGIRFGLIDESSKINLNVLPYNDAIDGNARDILMALPQMTEEIADSILDWLDPDDDERDFGTESSYYNGESPPYSAKNGPMDSLDELLLIRDVTPQLLFGLDSNRNGILDPAEAAAGDVSVSDADMYLGWANYLTLYSTESNLTGEGLQRINVNMDDLEQLYDDLKASYNDEWANFIIYARCNELGTGDHDTDIYETKSAALVAPDFDSLTSARKFDSLMDLVAAFVLVSDPEGADYYAPSPVQLENMPFTMPNLMANLTTYDGLTLPGRINIMQAPRRVLEAIPELDEDQVDLIISRIQDDRELSDPNGADLNRKFETWLLVEGIVDLETMKILMKYICTGGDVYRGEIVGYFADGAATSRAEVVLDTTVPIPRVLFWRSKSHLRGSFSIEAMGTVITE